jgi:hypothetical protein
MKASIVFLLSVLAVALTACEQAPQATAIPAATATYAPALKQAPTTTSAPTPRPTLLPSPTATTVVLTLAPTVTLAATTIVIPIATNTPTSVPTPTPTLAGADVVAVENMDLVGHLGGSTRASFVQGEYVYIGQGPHLAVLDISDRASHALVGKTAPFPHIVQDIDIVGNYAYVTTLRSGLRIVDISDPTTPIEVGFYDTRGAAANVVVAGDYAYVASSGSGVHVLDVSNPATLKRVGFYETWGATSGVAVASGYVYIADGDGGLIVLRHQAGN